MHRYLYMNDRLKLLFMNRKYYLITFSVLEEIVANMAGERSYCSQNNVTVGHFLHYLLRPLQELVPETANDLHTQAMLNSLEPIR